MAIKISFDTAHNPELPTIVLARRNGLKENGIKVKGVTVKDCYNNAAEISFEVNKYKYIDGKKVKDELWDSIKDFKLAWCKEWDTWFQLKVDTEESNKTTKTVYGTQLGVAELSQVMLYDIEINTETDIERKDYVPTVLYNPSNPKASLLHRLLEKAPHYSIIHVDATIAKIQRTFQFDNTSIYDSFQKIAEEIGCLFIFHSNSDSDGNIQRTISVYDLESSCNKCNYRGEFTGICPECGSAEINEGYGEDTTIFISADELANEIQLTSDTDSIKNCFKLEGGDDLMTATIRNCNPNGTDYIWYISDDMKEDMSKELVDKLNSYDDLYQYYQNDYIANLNTTALSKYNSLVEKYQKFNSNIENIKSPVKGYPALMTAYYNTVDLSVYLQTTLMPDASLADTSADKQAALLTVANLSPVAVTNLDTVSSATADNAVLGMAKAIIDSRYQVKINSSSFNNSVWQGNFVVTNYSDEEDTAISTIISIAITDNYGEYVKQKIKKALSKENINSTDIVGLFNMDYPSFCTEITKYALSSLTRFIDCCQSCIDILIEQGIADLQTWSGSDPNLYNDLYVPYYNKLKALQAEASLHQKEINTIIGVYNIDGELIDYGLQNYIVDIQKEIQDELDFQKYLGNELWLEFCSYRREDKYSNSNYISDGLNNAELFSKALEFIQVANNEIYKSAELQHSISTSLKNLLLMDKFTPLVEHFSVGNWIRILVDDKIYKLRLLEYEIDYDNIENISVEFSDVIKIADGISDTESVLSQAKSMATSYSSTQKQASQGAKSNDILQHWTENGLDATNTKIIGGSDNQTQTWDSHGMLFRKYNSITDSYDDIQLKIVNSTIAITNDNWKTVKTAIGSYYYIDPITRELKYAYGINAEVLIGKLILGESLGIYSENNSLVFDNDGLKITNGINSFIVNPNVKSLLKISNKNSDILWVDESGVLHIEGNGSFTGKIIANSGNIGGFTISNSSNKGTTSVGGHIYTESIYGHSYDDNYEYESGLRLSTTPATAMFYAARINRGNTWANPEYIFFIRNNGYLYAKDAEIEGKITANSGSIGGFTISNSYNVGTSAQGGHAYTASLYTHGEDDNYEYELGLKADPSPTSAVFYNFRIPKGSKWDATKEWLFYVQKNGKLFAKDAEIEGTITSTYVDTIHSPTPVTLKSTLSAGKLVCEGFFTAYKYEGTLDISFGGITWRDEIQKIGSIQCTSGAFPSMLISSNDGIELSGRLLCSDNAQFLSTVNFDHNVNLTSNDYAFYTANGTGYYLRDTNGTGRAGLVANSTGSQSVCTGGFSSDILIGSNTVNQGVPLTTSIQLRAKDVLVFPTTAGGSYRLMPQLNAVGSLGDGSHRWTTVYAATGSINTSDRNYKKDIKPIQGKYMAFFMDLLPRQFKFIDGTSDRIHIGFISQDVEEAMARHGITDLEFAGFCKDRKTQRVIDAEQVLDENGEVIQEEQSHEEDVLDENGEPVYIYSLRYEEFIALNTAVIQKQSTLIQEHEEKIVNLERKLECILEKLEELI